MFSLNKIYVEFTEIINNQVDWSELEMYKYQWGIMWMYNLASWLTFQGHLGFILILIFDSFVRTLFRFVK